MDAARAPAGRILIVDDEPRNLMILEEILEGFTVESAGSGEEALVKLAPFNPDLILLDIMMPDIDGYEVCRLIRRQERFRFTKVLFISGKAYLEDRLAGYQAGGDDYLVKPFEGDELLAKLRVFLRLKHVEEVLQIKSDFLALISHETMTPLTGILAVSEMLLERAPAYGDEAVGLAETLQSCGRRLMTFLEKTVLLCRLKASAELKGFPCPVDGIVEPVIEGLRDEARKRGIRIITTIDPESIHGDAELLSKAISYVVENALRFSPQGGIVALEGRKASVGGEYLLKVSDQGPGIGPGQEDEIFSEFAVRDVGHHTQGQGLSLAIARRILELHGGRLGVESHPGKGATFVFAAPLDPSG